MLEGGGVLRFLDEGGHLENKGLAIGAALKNVQYLVFITHRLPPPPIINDRSLKITCLFYFGRLYIIESKLFSEDVTVDSHVVLYRPDNVK
jgi:hypothetical protein